MRVIINMNISESNQCPIHFNDYPHAACLIHCPYSCHWSFFLHNRFLFNVYTVILGNIFNPEKLLSYIRKLRQNSSVSQEQRFLNCVLANVANIS